MSDLIIGERLQGISLEPQLQPVFFCACPTKLQHIESALREIRLKCGNPEIEKAYPSKCNCAFFVPCHDFRITAPVAEQLMFFFRRDKCEAAVFEYNWMEIRFYSRNEGYFMNPCRII